MYRVNGGWWVAAIGLVVCNSAQAAGYAVDDKSLSSMGAAFAGEAALAEDASIVYNNPAGMTQLKGHNIIAGQHYISSLAEFSDDGSNTTSSGDDKSTAEVLVPNLYYVAELTPALRAGFGLYAPFGLNLNYDEGWTGRYHTVKTDLRIVNLSPALAYQPAPRLSLGASLDVQYADAEMTQAVDFGSICVGLQGAATCNALGLQPQADDGMTRLKGDSWGYGASVGMTYEVSDKTRFGAVYHGPMRQELKGRSTFEDVPGAFAPVFTSSDVRITLHLPESIGLNLAHDASDRLRLLAGYTWTGWGRHKELRARFDNALPDSVNEDNWQDSSRYSVGAHYRLTPAWFLRGGFFYDETPVPDAEHRSPIAPDADRRFYTVGASWLPKADLSVDFAYAYMSSSDIPMERFDSSGIHEIDGTYKISGALTSLQVSWKF